MIVRVGRRRTFADLRRDGRRVRRGPVRISHLSMEIGAPSPQLAFALGRHFGKAVDRNRGRRRLRAAFEQAWAGGGAERCARLRGAFLLSGSRGLLHAPFAQLVADVDACLDVLAGQAAHHSPTPVAS